MAMAFGLAFSLLVPLVSFSPPCQFGVVERAADHLALDSSFLRYRGE